MSFGFSVSDFISITQLARNVYKRCRDARGEYRDLSRDVDSLYLVLCKVRDEAERPESLLNRQDSPQELDKLIRNCEEVLKQLSALVKKYGHLGKERPGVWERMKTPKGADLAGLRGKLTAQTAALSVYLETLGLGGIGRTEKKVDDVGNQLPGIKDAINNMAAEMRAGRREGSVMTTHTDDDKLVWREFRRELISEGYSSKVIGRFKESIKTYIKELEKQGLLDEKGVDSDHSLSDKEVESATCKTCSALLVECTCHNSAGKDYHREEYLVTVPDEADEGKQDLSLPTRITALVVAEEVYRKCNSRMPTVLHLNDMVMALRSALQSNNLDYSEIDFRGDAKNGIIWRHWRLDKCFGACFAVLQSVEDFINTYQSFNTEEERLEWSVSSNMEELADQLMTRTSELRSWRPVGCPSPYEPRLCVTCKLEVEFCHCERSIRPLRGLIGFCKVLKGESKPPTSQRIWTIPGWDISYRPPGWEPNERPAGWAVSREFEGRYFFIDPHAQGKEQRTFWNPPIMERNPSKALPAGWKRLVSATGRILYRHDYSPRESPWEMYGHPSDNPRAHKRPFILSRDSALIQTLTLDKEDRRALEQEREAACQIIPIVWNYPHIATVIKKNIFPGLTDFGETKLAIEERWQQAAKLHGQRCWGPEHRDIWTVYHLTPPLIEGLHRWWDGWIHKDESFLRRLTRQELPACILNPLNPSDSC
ncbi:MAG: hypothetical protein M1812_003548 [Candelaria pacifica]|nr:MAG: hypothetical protein M1812_003548 [Candelaria pacifica]